MQSSSLETLKLSNDVGDSIQFAKPFMDQREADQAFTILLSELAWEQPSITLFGKQTPIPRMQCWMGDATARYRYSGRLFTPSAWHPIVLRIKALVENSIGETFNSVLCNLYRNAQDSVAWHADDELEIDALKPIASVSLGETRSFQLKAKSITRNLPSQHTRSNDKPVKLDLPHNSLLVMPPQLQTRWLHQVPKSSLDLGPRINLTFRSIKPN